MGQCGSRPQATPAALPRAASLPKEKKWQCVLDAMDAKGLPYQTTVSLLHGLKRKRKITIYIHFQKMPTGSTVSATTTDNLLKAYQQAINQWVSVLGFENVQVVPFGFAFGNGVTPDASFVAKYGQYPVVHNAVPNFDKSPWESNIGNLSSVTANLYTLEVSRTRSNAGDTFPVTRDDWQTYTHPQGATGFQSVLCVTSEENPRGVSGEAQRHYIKVYKFNGTTDPLFKSVLLHEMGHVFGLDDLYDTGKYGGNMQCGPRTVNIQKEVSSVMLQTKAGATLTPFDKEQIKHAWKKAKQHLETHKAMQTNGA